MTLTNNESNRILYMILHSKNEVQTGIDILNEVCDALKDIFLKCSVSYRTINEFINTVEEETKELRKPKLTFDDFCTMVSLGYSTAVEFHSFLEDCKKPTTKYTEQEWLEALQTFKQSR